MTGSKRGVETGRRERRKTMKDSKRGEETGREEKRRNNERE
jgi:hypothetical protein